MAFIPVPNVARAELVFSREGVYMENVLNFEFTAPPVDTQLTTLAGELKAWWVASVDDNVGSDTSLAKIICTDLTTDSGPSIEYTTGLPIAGAGGQVGLPSNVTVAIKLNTPFRGRSYRGRIYHVGLRPGLVSGSSLTSGAVTQLLASYNPLLDPATFSECLLVVVSRFHDNAPRVEGVTSVVSSITVDPVLDSQRRRLPGRGS